ncbi:MAG: response regulator transcription factor [Gaiellaceae bacterium]
MSAVAVCAPKPRVVIADDHRLVLAALRKELELAGFDVCGEALTGAEALDTVFATRPDLALLDVHMPDGGGDELAIVLARELPEVKVVLLTTVPDEDEAIDALRSGARGYVETTISSRRLAHVLHDVSNGEVAFPRRFMPRLARELRLAALSAA